LRNVHRRGYDTVIPIMDNEGHKYCTNIDLIFTVEPIKAVSMP